MFQPVLIAPKLLPEPGLSAILPQKIYSKTHQLTPELLIPILWGDDKISRSALRIHEKCRLCLSELSKVQNLKKVINNIDHLVHQRDFLGNTIAHHAIIMGSTFQLKLMICLYPALLFQKNEAGATPLIVATEYKRIEMLSFLSNPSEIGLNCKLNVNLTYLEEKFTALHLAMVKGDIDSIKTLIKNGANLNELDIYGLTPTDWAAMQYYNYRFKAAKATAPSPMIFLQTKRFLKICQSYPPSRPLLAPYELFSRAAPVWDHIESL